MDKLGETRRHHWKERLKISNIAKFESDLFKTNEDIAPESRKILRTFFLPGPLHTNFCKFLQVCGAISSLA